MAWVKLDHKFHWDQLVEPLSDAAYRLYVGGLCYCNWQETDGHIPSGQLRRLIAQRMPASRLRRATEELQSAGLWASRLGDGFEVKNYLKFQPSKAQLEEQRESMRALGKRGGQASGLKRSGLSAAVEADSSNPVTSRHVTTVTSREEGVVENPPANGGVQDLQGEDLERVRGLAARLRKTPIRR